MNALLEATPAGFLRDGAPHTIISGAVHYFRVHPDQWRDRLRRVVAMGCNTVETYVAWNVHQPSPEATTFEGGADLGRFLDVAAEEGLDAIVRPGPYICAEWENGGFPGWIRRDQAMRLRTRDARYLRLVDAWFDELIPVIVQRQASRGGNVVMVQVENEYGSFGDDHVYLAHLRDGLRARGIDQLLVTSDGPARMWLTGGTIEGALPTVNFGSRTDGVLEMARTELPDQPYMCMEFWNGWFDHWGEEHHTRPAADAAAELETMLASGMSVNFYMAHGGTNFGLTAGANRADGWHQPTTTSYDYDSPIAENGALTEKFRAFREVIGRHRELPDLDAQLAELGLEAEPAHLPAAEILVDAVLPLAGSDLMTRTAPVHPMPPAFEDVGLERGIMRLSRRVEISCDGDGTIAPLTLYGLADRAWVYVDGILAGVADGNDRAPSVDLSPLADRLLPNGGYREVEVQILVENLGRTNFGPQLGERKGVLGGVWYQVRYHDDWQADPWPLEEMGQELTCLAGSLPQADPSAPVEETLPVLVRGGFEAEGDDPAGVTADAFLDLSEAGHGIAYVNGHCVGRYWSVGPQQSLYVPSPWLRPGRNEVVLLELERIPASLALSDGHVFSDPEGAADEG
jgi:beta-galactosidase